MNTNNEINFYCERCKRGFGSKIYKTLKDKRLWVYCLTCDAKLYVKLKKVSGPAKKENKKPEKKKQLKPKREAKPKVYVTKFCSSCGQKIGSNSLSMLCRGCWLLRRNE